MDFAPTAAEEAQKINDQTGTNRYGMSLVTDQDFWESQGIVTGEDLAVSVLNQSYSDFYKELNGFRPRHAAFKTVEEATAAINDLDAQYEVAAEEQRLEAETQANIERERAELDSLMPGEFDFEQYPVQTGMGRRMENKIRISKKQLESIIAEALSMSLPVSDVAAITQDDNEGEVYGHGGTARHARSHLFNVSTTAQSLHDKLHDDDELPEWVQSDLAVIEDKLSVVAKHLEYKFHRKDVD